MKDTWGDSATAVKNITLLPWVMGIKEQASWAGNLTLFPDPAGDWCELSVALLKEQRLDIKIFDISGKACLTILSNTYCASGPNRFMLPLDQLSPGLYFCRISGEAGCMYKRLIRLQK